MFDGFRSWLARALARPANQPGYLATLLQTSIPPRRGTAELMAAYSRLPWLRAVTSRVADAVASAQWTLQRGDQTLDSHPLLDLLDQANDLMTGAVARKLTQIYLDLKGEAFWVLERSARGQPVQYYPVPPHWVLSTPTAEQPVFRVSGGRWQGEIPATDVIWLRDPDPLNPYGRGSGIAEALGDELDTDEYTAKHVKAWFYNRAVPELLIGIENASETELQRAQDRWENDHRGFLRAYRSHWYAGKMDVVRLDQTFQNQQLVELRQFERDTIVQVFGVPPEILGIIQNSNRATIDSADYLFAKWVVRPRLEFLRSEMQEKLVPLFGDDSVKLGYESPVPEDQDYRLRVAQAAPWALTRNEWRQMMDQPPDPNGDVYLVPVGLVAEDKTQPTMQQQSSVAVVRKALGEDAIPNILEALRPERLTEPLDPEFAAAVEAFGEATLRELGIDVPFNMLNPKVVEFLHDFSATRIGGLVNQTTREALRQTLIEGVRAGEDIQHLARRIMAVFSDADLRRARMIARTEVLRGSNFGTYQAHVISGVVSARQWVATPDERTREAHRELNGQVQAIDHPFVVNGQTAMYPGDFADPALDINCRCTTVAVIDQPKGADQLLAVWKAYDRNLIPWERRIEQAAKRGFAKQQEDVLKALEQVAGRDANGQ